jgi:hypothetical protein
MPWAEINKRYGVVELRDRIEIKQNLLEKWSKKK